MACMVVSGHVVGCESCIATIFANLGVGHWAVVGGIALNIGLEHPFRPMCTMCIVPSLWDSF
jgi:hypothetical protein